MKYKLSNVIDKPTSTGKAKKQATLTAEDGTITQNVGIWSDFPDFANLKDGMAVVGEIKSSPDGKWTNLMPPKSGTNAYGANRGQSGAVKAAEITSTNVRESQEHKDRSIKISSTMRDAVLIVTAKMAQWDTAGNRASWTDDYIKTELQTWRKWLVEHWDDANVPF